MRVAVFSDSHGDFFRMWETLGKLHRERALDAVFFLGDGCEEFCAVESSFHDPRVAFLAVTGNNDYAMRHTDFPPPAARIADLAPYRALLVHGDACGAKNGASGPAALARRNGCGIVLHGHTHLPRCEVDRGENGDLSPVYVFCPGSIGEPRRGKASYGILTVEGEKVTFTVENA